MTPLCVFCKQEIVPEDGHRAILDDGWSHELCWWKRECARLQAEVDELRDTPDGGSSPLPRHARHSIGSEPTECGQNRYCVEGNSPIPGSTKTLPSQR